MQPDARFVPEIPGEPGDHRQQAEYARRAQQPCFAPFAPRRFAFQPFHEPLAEPFGQLRTRGLLQRATDYVIFRFHAVAYLPVYTVFCGCGGAVL